MCPQEPQNGTCHHQIWCKVGENPHKREMLRTAYGDKAVSKAQAFRWSKRFQGGKEDVEDDPRSAAPKTTSSPDLVDRVRNLLAKECGLAL
jgi:hypothetical protein